MSNELQDALRRLPAVGVLVETFRREFPGEGTTDHELLSYLARCLITECRSSLVAASKSAGRPVALPSTAELVGHLHQALVQWRTSSRTCRVINGTGIILHSGLGRAVLPLESLRSLAGAEGYVLLEVDKEHGERRRRDLFIEELLLHLTGAEAAFTVNNNAAATMIILNTCAAGREVVVSRSQMVEIGGSFRMPDVMTMSGCRLREVGTTNRSYVADYEKAIGPETGALMLVHTSNYKIIGFCEHVGLDELVKLGRKHKLPVIHDIGAGSLLPASVFGFDEEPPVQASVKSGADLVCFSGDKMIGGTQAGMIVGTKTWVDRIRANPLARALRIDKLSCLALEAALKLYFEPSRLFERVPTLAMIRRTSSELRARALDLSSRLNLVDRDSLRCLVLSEFSEVGAGSLPAVGLPTYCVAIECLKGSVKRWAAFLRKRHIPIFTRIKDNNLLLDVRTLLPGDDEEILAAFAKGCNIEWEEAK